MDDYPVDSINQGASEIVYATHTTGLGQFFVHIDSQSYILDEIMEKLASRYIGLTSSDKLLAIKRPGSLCAANFIEDNNWYRAKITGVIKNDLIEVHFVDYGNTDYVNEDCIKALDADLLMYPVRSYKCVLSGVSCAQSFWTPEVMVQFEDLVLDKRCRAVFKGKKDDDETYLVDMYDEEDKLINALFGATTVDSGFSEIKRKVGDKLQATVVYCKSPNLFWCQENESVNSVLLLSEELSRLHMTQNMKPIKNCAPGTVCAAKFSEDEAWYRGVVQSVAGNVAEVNFIDYGNTEKVDLAFVTNLSPEMRELPALAVRCCLSNTETKNWPKELCDEFETLVMDKELEVKIVGKKGDIFEVTLFDVIENSDVGSMFKLITDRLKSKPLKDTKSLPLKESHIKPMSVGCKMDVFLSWVESPGDFWVQRVDTQQLLDDFSNSLQQHYSKPQPMAPSSPGAVVVARYSEDQMWYRGIVLKELEDGTAQVLFLDYGNSESIHKDELRQVTPAFGEVIPLAVRCCLWGVKSLRKGDQSWNNDAKDFLESLTKDGAVCEVVNETVTHKHVRLTVGNKDIAKELVALRVVSDAQGASPSASSTPNYANEINLNKSQKEMVTVSHVDSAKSFYCLLTKYEQSLINLMGKLEVHYCNEGGTPVRDPKVGQACISRYSVDNNWYRGQVTKVLRDNCEILFVDYGNKENVPCSAVCVPEPRFLDLPTQAVHCSLPVSGDAAGMVDAFSNLVMDKELQLEVLEVVNDVYIVELHNGNQQISKLVGKLNCGQQSVPDCIQQTMCEFTPAKAIALNTPMKMFASYSMSPSKFFLQMAESEETLTALMDRISSAYACDSPPALLGHPHVGQPCVALYSEDDQWYRGRVVSVSGISCKVLFVDYGNEEEIGLQSVRTILPDIAKVPIMAYQCLLSDVPEQHWSAPANEHFESLIMDQELQCTFVSPSSVKLKSGGDDIATLLIKAGHSKTATSSIGEGDRWDEQVQPIPEKRGLFGSSVDRFNNDRKGFNSGPREQSSFGGQQGDRFNNDRKGFNSSSSGREQSSFGGQKENDDWDEPAQTVSEKKGFNSSGDRFNNDRKGFNSGPREQCGFGTQQGERFNNDRKGFNSGPREQSSFGGQQGDRFNNDRKGFNSGPREQSSFGGQQGDRFNNDRKGFNSSSSGREQSSFGGQQGDRFNNDRKGFNSSSSGREQSSFGGQKENDEWDEPAQTVPEKKGFNSSGDRFNDRKGFNSGAREQGGFGGQQGARPSSSSSSDKESPFSERGSGNNFERSNSRRQGADGDGGFKNKKSDTTSTELVYPTPPTETEAAILVHMDDDGTFYLQLPSMERDIVFLSKKLAYSYKTSGPRLRDEVKVGTVCCSKFSADGSMYRCKVEELLGSKVLVRYIDYGNTSECSAHDLKFIFPDIFQFPVLAFQCRLRGFDWSVDKSEQFLSLTLDKDIKVTFTTFDPPYQVDITTDSGDLLALLTGQALAPALKQSPKPASSNSGPFGSSKSGSFGSSNSGPFGSSNSRPFGGSNSGPFGNTNSKLLDSRDTKLPISMLTTPLPQNAIPKQEFLPQPSLQGTYSAYITHIAEGGYFYLQLAKDSSVLEDISAKLANATDTVKHPSVKPGVCCRAVFSDDSCWYRALVTSVVDDNVQVCFVDYGNGDIVKSIDVIPLTSELLVFPPLAYKCQFEDSLSSEAQAKLADYLMEHELAAEFLSGSDPFKVRLSTSDGADLWEIISPSTGFRSQRIPAETVPASVSHIEEDGRIYLQLYGDQSAISEFQESLTQFYRQNIETELETLELGMPCCITDDSNNWHRAVVKGIENEVVTVVSVDSGKAASVEKCNIRNLPPQFLLKPPFAWECWLSGVENWTGDLRAKLAAITDNKIFNASFQTSTPPFRVSLTRSIELDLLGLTAPVIVKPVKPEPTKAPSDQDVAATTEENSSEVSPVISSTMLGDDKGIESSDKLGSDLSNLVGHRVALSVSYVLTPDKFYLHLDEAKGVLDELMDEMYEHFTNLPECVQPAESLAVGQLCAALYTDESWYRVRIESQAEDGTYQIFYIDHGNTEILDISTLQVLPDKFKELPSFAVEGKLGGVVPVGGIWTEEAVEDFKNMVEEKSLLADIIAIENSSCIVHLLELGIPVHEALVKKGYATLSCESLVSKAVQQVFPDANDSMISSCLESTHVEGDEKTAQQTMMTTGAHAQQKISSIADTLEDLQEVAVCVSHAVNPSYFWCQLATATDTLTEISQSLATLYSTPHEDDIIHGSLNPGDIVVALFVGDDLFYRAEVMNSDSVDEPESVSSATVSVRFIDYGNTSHTPTGQVYKIREELCHYPSQAFPCCLDQIKCSEDVWSTEACSKFSELVEDKELTIKLVGRVENRTLLVDLLYPDSGERLASRLIADGFGSLVEAQASYVDSSRSEAKHCDTNMSLEMNPIMESTVMAGEIVQGNLDSYTLEEPENGYYRNVRLTQHSEYDVEVANDELPSSFFVQLVELKNQYSSMMAEIAEHIVSDSCHDLNEFTPEAGGSCLVQHYGIWYRGEIISQEGDLWNVKSVDLGWEVSVSMVDLKPLPSQFQSQPSQGVPCYLAGIVSVNAEWSPEAISFFKESISGRKLKMDVLEHGEDGKYGVYIFDLDDTSVQSVNRAMVEMGFAEVVPGSNIDVDIQMEKTLDTDMLNDLEESFNEVSILKCNDDGENQVGEESSESPSYRGNVDTIEDHLHCLNDVDNMKTDCTQPHKSQGDCGMQQGFEADKSNSVDSLESEKSFLLGLLDKMRKNWAASIDDMEEFLNRLRQISSIPQSMFSQININFDHIKCEIMFAYQKVSEIDATLFVKADDDPSSSSSSSSDSSNDDLCGYFDGPSYEEASLSSNDSHGDDFNHNCNHRGSLITLEKTGSVDITVYEETVDTYKGDAQDKDNGLEFILNAVATKPLDVVNTYPLVRSHEDSVPPTLTIGQDLVSLLSEAEHLSPNGFNVAASESEDQLPTCSAAKPCLESAEVRCDTDDNSLIVVESSVDAGCLDESSSCDDVDSLIVVESSVDAGCLDESSSYDTSSLVFTDASMGTTSFDVTSDIDSSMSYTMENECSCDTSVFHSSTSDTALTLESADTSTAASDTSIVGSALSMEESKACIALAVSPTVAADTSQDSSSSYYTTSSATYNVTTSPSSLDSIQNGHQEEDKAVNGVCHDCTGSSSVKATDESEHQAQDPFDLTGFDTLCADYDADISQAKEAAPSCSSQSSSSTSDLSDFNVCTPDSSIGLSPRGEAKETENQTERSILVAGETEYQTEWSIPLAEETEYSYESFIPQAEKTEYSYESSISRAEKTEYSTERSISQAEETKYSFESSILQKEEIEYSTERSIPQAEEIEYSTERFIPQAEEIEYSSERFIPQAEEIEYSSERFIPQAEEIEYSSERFIPQAEEIEYSTERFIPQAEEIEYSSERFIPQAEEIEYSTERSIPQAEEIEYSSERFIPQAEEIEYSTERFIPQAEEIEYSTERFIPQAEEIEYSSERFIPQAEEIEYSTERSIPQAEEIEYSSERFIPQAEEIEYSSERSIPQAEEIEYSSERFIPQAEEIEYSTERSIPQAEEIEYSSERFIPQTEETEYSTERFIPQAEEIEYSTERFIPQAEEIEYSSERFIPQAEETEYSTERFIPQAEEIEYSTERFIPLAEEKEYSTERFIPQAEEIEYSTERFIPLAEEKEYSTERFIPQAEEIEYSSERFIPQAEEILYSTERFIPQAVYPTVDTNEDMNHSVTLIQILHKEVDLMLPNQKNEEADEDSDDPPSFHEDTIETPGTSEETVPVVSEQSIPEASPEEVEDFYKLDLGMDDMTTEEELSNNTQECGLDTAAKSAIQEGDPTAPLLNSSYPYSASCELDRLEESVVPADVVLHKANILKDFTDYGALDASQDTVSEGLNLDADVFAPGLVGDSGDLAVSDKELSADNPIVNVIQECGDNKRNVFSESQESVVENSSLSENVET